MSGYILGVSQLENHDLTYAILTPAGEVLYIGEEERFSRVKHSLTPHVGAEAFYYALRRFGLRPEDFVLVAFGMEARGIRTLQERALLKALGLNNVETVHVHHHLAHAASSYFISPFDEAAVLTLDGFGDRTSWGLFHGKDRELVQLASQQAPHSIGHLYLLITIWLGLGGFGDEGKTMGLAPYGKPTLQELFEQEFIRIDRNDGHFYLHDRLIEDLSSLAAIESVLGPARKPGEPLTEYHQDVAATLQVITEEVQFRLAERACMLAGTRKLCLAGGVALNSVANGKLVESGRFEAVFVPPSASDSGTALGAALYAAASRPRPFRRFYTFSPYLGADCSEDDIVGAIQERGLSVHKVEYVERVAAQALAAGKIIGWYQGRAEIGPRALGNRSILANPLLPDMRDRVNNRVKYREPWRPFAPSVLEEDYSLLFDGGVPNGYMTMVFRFLPHVYAMLPSVVHIDGTGRVQTVGRDLNPRFHTLIAEFKRITGYGVVLNTSFNLGGEPIVNTPAEALDTFLHSDMDCLFLGDYLIEKKDVPPTGLRVEPRFRTVFRPFELAKSRLVVLTNGPGTIFGDEIVYHYLRKKNLGFTLVQRRNQGMDPLVSPEHRPIVYDDDTMQDTLESCFQRGYDAILIKIPSGPLFWRLPELLIADRFASEHPKTQVYVTSSVYDVVPLQDLRPSLRVWRLIHEYSNLQRGLSDV